MPVIFGNTDTGGKRCTRQSDAFSSGYRVFVLRDIPRGLPLFVSHSRSSLSGTV
jgi:hypothetical protein